MSETTPDRGIGALAPRPRRDVSSLVAKNRPPHRDAPPQAAEAASEPQEPAEATIPSPVANKPRAPRATPQRPSRAATAAKNGRATFKITIDIDLAVITQARAAYRAAGYFEGVPSFSEYAENALRRENERVAAAYNGGTAFDPVNEPLRPGRKPGA